MNGKLVVKAITLHQPWASLIIAGAKRFETRSWGAEYTGLLVIHAGKTLLVDTQDKRFMGYLKASGIGDTRKLPLGAALGVVWKGKCYRGESLIPYIDDRERAFGGFLGDDRVAWELKYPTAFAAPIPMKGAQGLWNYPLPLPEEILAHFNQISV